MQQLHPTKIILGLLAAPLAAASGWLCGAAAKYGLHLDQSGINALATAGAAGGLGIVAKLIHDVGAKHPTITREAQTLAAVAEKADPQLVDELNAWPPAPAPAPAATAAQTPPAASEGPWSPGAAA